MTLVHRLRPADGEPAGALVLNHGRGSDENDLYGLLDELDPERRLLGITTGAPLTGVPPGGRHWYLVPRVGHPDPATFAASYAALCGFIGETLTEHGLDWSQALVGGFSMGAVMSYAVALGPGRPAAAGVIALSGFIPTVDGWQLDLEAHAETPVLIHHGRRDPVIDVEFARQARELLEGGGLPVTYYESDAPHAVPPQLLPLLREFVSAALPA
ncbi:MAG: phospholipase/carboxylesterase [Solirubrobacterales bacterium]|nr:phospholipase/carboxylesterase [Solirubrobacterales bacterium]